MQPTSHERRAFDEFLETTRRDIFKMYESTREVQRGDGLPMGERLDVLNAVAAKAWDVYASIAELNAAVWFPLLQPGAAMGERDERVLVGSH